MSPPSASAKNTEILLRVESKTDQSLAEQKETRKALEKLNGTVRENQLAIAKIQEWRTQVEDELKEVKNKTRQYDNINLGGNIITGILGLLALIWNGVWNR